MTVHTTWKATLLILYCLLVCPQVFALSVDAGVTTEAASLISGIVTDPSDTPVSGALVRLIGQVGLSGTESDQTSTSGIQSSWDACKFETTGQLVLGSTITDTSGTFHLALYHRGKVVIVACSEKYSLPTSASVNLVMETTSIVRLRFAVSNRFSAYVTDAGVAVAGAIVRISYLQGNRLRQSARETDPDGRAIFEGISATELERLEVRSASHARFESKVRIQLPSEGYPVWLLRKGSIEVEVKDPNPALEKKAASVWLLYAAEVETSSGVASSYALPAHAFVSRQSCEISDGKAIFPGMEPGWYKAIAQHSAARGESNPVHVAAGEAVTRIAVALDQSAAVEGLVTDKETGERVAGAAVTLVPDGGVPSQMQPFAALSDADGKFSFEAIPGGSMKLMATHAKYSPHSEFVQVLVGKDSKITVPMSIEKPGLTGDVVSDGTPLAGALVVLYKAGVKDAPVATAISDSVGRYDLGERESGVYVVSVEAPIGTGDEISGKTYSVTLEDKPVSLDINFTRPVQVSGRVSRGGKPLVPGAGTTSLLFTRIAGGSISKVIPLMQDGSFEAALEPGTYSVGLEDKPGTQIEISDLDGGQLFLEL